MNAFFIAVEPRRGRVKKDTYNVMVRYKDESSPFEQTRKVATCVDQDGAAKLQELFDMASNLGGKRSGQKPNTTSHSNGVRRQESASVTDDQQVTVTTKAPKPVPDGLSRVGKYPNPLKKIGDPDNRPRVSGSEDLNLQENSGGRRGDVIIDQERST